MNLSFLLSFLYPNFLWLLLLVPLFLALGWPEQRRQNRRRAWLGMAIRLVILLLLILGLSGAQLERAVDQVTTVFLLDVSDSVNGDDRQQAESFMRQALAEMPAGDKAAVILFGDDALVEQLPRTENDFPALNAIPVQSATDIENALRLGLALLPNEGGGRLLLLSDGQETAGDALRLANLAAARQVEISAVPLGVAAGTSTASGEMLVEQVVAPAQAREGEAVPVEVTVRANQPGQATLRLLADGRLVDSMNIRLNQGRNQYRFNVPVTEAGFRRFRVELSPQEAASDGRLQNNWGAAFTNVFGPPQVLVVAANTSEVEHLTLALEAAGLNPTVSEPGVLPDSLADYTAYDSIVLANVPANLLPTPTQETLASYVRDLGRGLVMLGGPDSYGAGGYLRSPLEEALPVDMEVKDRSKEPNIALVLAVDKSGSMGACHCDDPDLRQAYNRVQSGLPKIDIAKDAIFQASVVLGDLDYMGVVSFDDSAHWEVDVAPWVGTTQLEEEIGGMTANGQTNIFAGLTAAEEQLVAAPARIKHIILLTDGWSRSGAYQDITDRFQEEGITLSVVAAGGGSAEYLAQLAEQGGGQYYPAVHMNDVPQIFLKETIRAVGNYIIEEPFLPVSTVSNSPSQLVSPILSGMDLSAVPPLIGYNGTTAKAAARTPLLTPRGDPLLATWQYGLGRSVAWTSDLSGRWAREWLDWESFAPFAAQMVGWTLPVPGETQLALSVSGGSNQVTLTAQTVGTGDAVSDQAQVAAIDTVAARLISAEGEIIDAELLPIGAGRFQATVPLPEEGVYLAQVTAFSEEAAADEASVPLVGQTAGIIVPYSAEYAAFDADLTLLNDVTAIASGQIMTDPAQAFVHNLVVGRQSTPIWSILLLWAALLFPLDVAVRRLRLGRQEWLQVRQWFARWIPGLKPATAPALDQSPTLQAFRQVRQRTRSPRAPATPSATTARDAKSQTTVPPAEAAETTTPEPDDDPADTLSRLRAAKRRARK